MTPNTLEEAGIPAGATPVGSLAREEGDWPLDFFPFCCSSFGNILPPFYADLDCRTYKRVRRGAFPQSAWKHRAPP